MLNLKIFGVGHFSEFKNDHVYFNAHSILFWLYVISAVLLMAASASIFIYRLEHTFLSEGYADELIFTGSLDRMLVEGWWSVVAQGCSPVFNLAGAFVNLFTGNTLSSLRLVSLLSMFGLIFLWTWYYYRLMKPPILQFMAASFLITLVGVYRITFYWASNDSLMVLLISAALICLLEACRLKGRTGTNLLFFLSGFFAALALGTRELFVFYVPGFIVIFFIYRMFVKNALIPAVIMFSVAFCFVTSVIHAPSLIEEGKLSFQSKEPSEMKALWVERFYLTVKQLDGGIIKDVSERATWEDVVKYKTIYGPDALPATNFQAIMRDPALTIKNFFTVAFYAQLPFLRQIGILYPLFFVSLVIAFFKNRLLPVSLAIGSFFLFFLAAFSIIILEHVEFRWLMVFPFMLILASIFQSSILFNKYHGYHLILTLNYMALAGLTIFKIGVW